MCVERCQRNGVPAVMGSKGPVKITAFHMAVSRSVVDRFAVIELLAAVGAIAVTRGPPRPSPTGHTIAPCGSCQLSM